VTRVLVVEDEESFSDAISYMLRKEGFEVAVCATGPDALETFDRTGADLVLLDLMLPGLPGSEVCRSLRERSSVPVIMLTAKDSEIDKVVGLELGADDYVTKPFGMDELLARMRAALRHQLQTHGERPVFRLGDLSVDLVRRIVKVGTREVKLSPKEYDLLRVLVQHAGKVLTHKFLLGELWDDLTDAQYLRVYVRQLRQKIEADPERPHYVLTETGIGYRLRAPD